MTSGIENSEEIYEILQLPEQNSLASTRADFHF